MDLTRSISAIVEPLEAIFPEYHPDAADINEALDHGVASCAVRAYASGLLIRHAFPNRNLYVVNFGRDPVHGGEFEGENGVYMNMGHAVTRLWIPEQRPLIVESNNDYHSKIEVTKPMFMHADFIWAGLDEGYREYLDLIDMEDVEVDVEEVTDFLLKAVSEQS